MRNFQDNSKKSFEAFIDTVIENKLSFHKLSSTKSVIVSITDEEEKFYQSMESKTIKEIEAIIIKEIGEIGNKEVIDAVQENFKNYKKRIALALANAIKCTDHRHVAYGSILLTSTEC